MQCSLLCAVWSMQIIVLLRILQGGSAPKRVGADKACDWSSAPDGSYGGEAPPCVPAAAVPEAQRAVTARRRQQRARGGRLGAHSEHMARLPALRHGACARGMSHTIQKRF